MFVQQKKLTHLNMPSKRLRRFFSSTVDVQIALPGYPAQMASAYLSALASRGGIQVILGLFLVQSRCSVFFLPPSGEVAPEQAEMMVQSGLEFAESMGFVLADADIHKLRPEKLDALWTGLPICNPPAPEPVTPEPEVATEKTEAVATKQPPVTKPAVPKVQQEIPVEEKKQKPVYTIEERRKRCKESLGRFLASL